MIEVQSTFFIIVAGIVLAVTLCCVWCRVCNAHRLRRAVSGRLSMFRIGRMLQRLGISRRRFLGSQSRIRVEKQLFICEHCPDTETCDQYLDEGREIDERTFCPNYREFSDLMKEEGSGR